MRSGCWELPSGRRDPGALPVGGGAELTSMVAAAGGPLLLAAGIPLGAWGLLPLCKARVFLLICLKLWDLEHALGCRSKTGGPQDMGGGANGGHLVSLVSSSTLAPHPHPLQACWVSWPWQRGPGTFNLPWGESGCCGASPGSYPGRSPTRAAAAVGDQHTGLTPSSIEAPDPVPACLPVVARTPCLSCSGNGNCHRPGPISSRNESRVGPGGGAASTRAHLRCPTFPGRPLPSSSSSSVPPHPPRYPDPDLLTPWACVGAGEGVSGVPMWNLEARFRPLRGPGFPHCQVGMMRHLPPGAKYTLCKQC